MKNAENPFNWERARQTVERARESLSQTNRSEEEISQIFRQRAERLARAAAFGQPMEESEAVAIFRIGEWRFGIPLSDAAEMTAGAKIAAAPGTRPHIAGLVQVRGDVRVAVDLRILLELPAPAADFSAVLFLRRNGGYLGVPVTAVEDIRTIAAAERRPAPAEARCAAWMAEDLTIVLDTAAIFSRAIEEP